VLTPAEVERRLYGAPLPDINRPPPLTCLSAGAAEARAILEKIGQANQPKEETEMPDMQTALLSAISHWDDEPNPPKPTKEKPVLQQVSTPQPAHQGLFKPTNNISRETFDYVKHHPLSTSKEISEALAARGFREGSVSSLLTQMARQGMLAKDETGPKVRYTAKQGEYTPIKSYSTIRNREAKKQAKKAGIAALKADTGAKTLGQQLRDKLEATNKEIEKARTVVAEPEPKAVLFINRTPQQILSQLNILQARALYDELKKVFGG